MHAPGHDCTRAPQEPRSCAGRSWQSTATGRVGKWLRLTCSAVQSGRRGRFCQLGGAFVSVGRGNRSAHHCRPGRGRAAAAAAPPPCRRCRAGSPRAACRSAPAGPARTPATTRCPHRTVATSHRHAARITTHTPPRRTAHDRREKQRRCPSRCTDPRADKQQATSNKPPPPFPPKIAHLDVARKGGARLHGEVVDHQHRRVVAQVDRLRPQRRDRAPSLAKGVDARRLASLPGLQPEDLLRLHEVGGLAVAAELRSPSRHAIHPPALSPLLDAPRTPRARPAHAPRTPRARPAHAPRTPRARTHAPLGDGSACRRGAWPGAR
jgi:hypothetical protein